MRAPNHSRAGAREDGAQCIPRLADSSPVRPCRGDQDEPGRTRAWPPLPIDAGLEPTELRRRSRDGIPDPDDCGVVPSSQDRLDFSVAMALRQIVVRADQPPERATSATMAWQRSCRSRSVSLASTMSMSSRIPSAAATAANVSTANAPPPPSSIRLMNWLGHAGSTADGPLRTPEGETRGAQPAPQAWGRIVVQGHGRMLSYGTYAGRIQGSPYGVIPPGNSLCDGYSARE